MDEEGASTLYRSDFRGGLRVFLQVKDFKVLVGDHRLVLELLRQVAPNVTRVAVIRDSSPGGFAEFGAIQNAAPSLRMEVVPVNADDPGDIERGIVAFSRQPNGGAVVTGTSATIRYRAPIIALAARHRLPTVYPLRLFVAEGGLVSHGAAAGDLYRRSAGYEAS